MLLVVNLLGPASIVLVAVAAGKGETARQQSPAGLLQRLAAKWMAADGALHVVLQANLMDPFVMTTLGGCPPQMAPSLAPMAPQASSRFCLRGANSSWRASAAALDLATVGSI